jgi:hypothetical protein
MWGRQGRELLYSDTGNDLVSVPLQFDGDEIHAGKPSRLFAIPGSIGEMATRDGEHFLVERANEAAPGPSLRLVLGWTGLVKR